MGMNMSSRKQYLRTLHKQYQAAKKKQKGKLLDEFIKNTGHNRKYIIHALNDPYLFADRPKTTRKRKCMYDNVVISILAKIWEIFDCPCGQRLKPLLETEVDRLIGFEEIKVSEEVRKKLLKISSSTIDRRLRNKKSQQRRRMFSTTKPGSLLKYQIPVRLNEWDKAKIGYTEMDLVAHCGGNSSGEFINTLSVTDISSGWWDGYAVMGKGMHAVFNGLKTIKDQLPFLMKGADSDNGGEFINEIILRYCLQEKIEFTRGRPGRKNDNAYVEQKNWTHVRKTLGYLRYDTETEQKIINDLYQDEYSTYKNFFQTTLPCGQLFLSHLY
jgi:hypothetical protein